MKKITVLFACLFAVCVLFAGCGQQGQSQQESLEPMGEPFDFSMYDETLDQVEKVLALPADAEIPDGMEGIFEFGQIYGEEAEKLLGYQYDDLNKDGTPELLVGVSLNDENSCVQNQIYLVYTVKQEEPVQILSGYGRSSYSLLTDGHLAYFGSEGASYSIFGEYALNEENQWDCTDYYFTHEVDGDFGNIGVFHNTTGNFDVVSSDALSITLDEFFELEEELAMRAIPLFDYNSFSDFQYIEK